MPSVERWEYTSPVDGELRTHTHTHIYDIYGIGNRCDYCESKIYIFQKVEINNRWPSQQNHMWRNYICLLYSYLETKLNNNNKLTLMTILSAFTSPRPPFFLWHLSIIAAIHEEDGPQRYSRNGTYKLLFPPIFCEGGEGRWAPPSFSAPLSCSGHVWALHLGPKGPMSDKGQSGVVVVLGWLENCTVEGSTITGLCHWEVCG